MSSMIEVRTDHGWAWLPLSELLPDRRQDENPFENTRKTVGFVTTDHGFDEVRGQGGQRTKPLSMATVFRRVFDARRARLVLKIACTLSQPDRSGRRVP